MSASGFASFIFRHRVLAVVACICLFLFAASGVKNLTMTTNTRVYFGEDNPQLMAFNKFEESFVETNEIFFIIEAKDGKIFQRNHLQAIQDLTREAWRLPFTYRVDSITNYQHTNVKGDELIVGDFVDDLTGLTQAHLNTLEQVAMNEPMVANRLISERGDVSGVLVSMQYPGLDKTEITRAALAGQKLADEMAKKYPGLNLRLTGSSMISNAFTEASLHDFATLVPAMYLIIFVILSLLLRSVLAVLLVLVNTVLVSLAALGTAGWLGIQLTPTAATSVNIMLTIVVANSVHLLMTFFHNYGDQSRFNATKKAVETNLFPIVLTSVTTAIGFLSLNLSDVPPFADLGNIVAIGVVYAFLLSQLFFSPILSWLPISKRSIKNSVSDKLMLSLSNFVINYRTPIWVSTILISALIGSFAPTNIISDRYPQYFDESTAFRQASDFADDNLAGLFTIEYVLESGEPGGITDPAYLKEVESFASWLRVQPEIRSINVLTDTMKQINMNLNGGDTDYYALPKSKDLAAQYLLLYELSLPFGLDLTTRTNLDKSATRLTASLPSMDTPEFIGFQRRAYQWLKDNTRKEMHYEGASLSLMFGHLGERAMLGSIKGTFAALIIISMIIFLALRSFKLGFISLIPNLLPAIVGFGVWALTNGKIGLSLSTALGITMGIVVDDSVHFLSKYSYAKNKLNHSAEDSVRYAMTSAGPALMITTLALTVGFLLLTFSFYKPNADMGLLTSIIIVVALIFDFLLLPSLLLAFDNKGMKETDRKIYVDNSYINLTR